MSSKGPKTGLKKILAIAMSDLKRITNSIVAVVIIFGLCVIPCLYGWFNILSNWDPYGSDATGRIKIAVVSVDKGAEILGLELNVGEEVISGLEANDTIGWVFCDSLEEAYNLALSGDCYAAIVIPEEFSEDVLSFMDLGFQHPTINYYENQKKNAIAPKITAKAKTAVQQQVNATFIETIASVFSNVLKVFDAAGVDYDSTLDNLCTKVDNLQTDLDQVDGLLASLCHLCSAAEQLMYYSGQLSEDIAVTSAYSQKTASDLSTDIGTLNTNITALNTGLKDSLVEADYQLQKWSQELQEHPEDKDKILEEIKSDGGYIGEEFYEGRNDISGREFAALAEVVAKFQTGQADANELAYALLEARTVVLYTLYSTTYDISPEIQQALASLAKSSGTAASAFGSAADTASSLSGTLYDTVGTLQQMEKDLYEVRQDIVKAEKDLRDISKYLDELKDSEFLREIVNTAIDNNDNISTYFASPIQMKTVVQYPIDNYGSTMAPFYTVLAQWVGALFCATMLKAKIRKKDFPYDLNVAESYFGRYVLFLAVCLIQALVVSIGDLVFIDIYCVHPVQFVLAAVVTGICFATINYTLSYALEKIGLGASVIIMVIQVAGSGGSYPVNVLPEIFQILYPFMPFKYAMNAMREAIGGTYGNNYLIDLLVLVGVTILFIIVGLLIKKPASKLNDLINESSEKAEIML